MNMKFFGIFAVLGCVAFAGDTFAGSRSSMYSSINMTNSDGDTIKINRSAYESHDYSHNLPYNRHMNRYPYLQPINDPIHKLLMLRLCIPPLNRR